MTMLVRLTWKAEKRYWDKDGPYSDEFCDDLELWHRQWLKSQERPKSEIWWKSEFGLRRGKAVQRYELAKQEREDLEAAWTMEVLLSRAGVPYKAAGEQLMANCPFHKDDRASMRVHLKKKVWYCFGCQERGNIWGFVMKFYNLTFPQAIKLLKG